MAVRAPELIAGAWLGTSRALLLSGLRGRWVLLDFWTSACGNCLHLINELRRWEQLLPPQLREHVIVVGVHSPKFDHEQDATTVADAMRRYGVDHPVLNDPDRRLWQQYAVRAWPTLVLVDPEGYIVAQVSGERQLPGLAATIIELSPRYRLRGTPNGAQPAPAQPDQAQPDHAQPDHAQLSYPAKAIALAGGSVLVADAGHHQLVEIEPATGTVLRRIGSGARGLIDAAAPDACFAEPNGLTLVPPQLAGIVGYDVVVADTANHVLRGVRLLDGAVVATIDLHAALDGARTITGPVPAVLSPWDVTFWPASGRFVVAAAGVHLLLAVDLREGAGHCHAEVLAGTTVEGLRDGPALDAWLAQPSGLGADADGLWFVDAETSALRRLSLDGRVHTAVGEGLFDFGDLDGPARTARFQHPLGVTVLGDRSVAVLDTYNGAVRRYDPATDTVGTLARGLREPSGALLVGAELYVVESAAHRLSRPVGRAELPASGPGV